MDIKELRKSNLIFKKIKFKDEFNTESYHINSPRDFDTLGVYLIDDEGVEHYILDIDQEYFRELILNYLRRKI